jgi:hypothetical protein
MKKNTLELKKKLLLNKQVITKLTPAQQAKVVGGASGANHLICTDPSLAVCYKQF